MRVTIPVALLAATLLAGAALGQGMPVGTVNAQSLGVQPPVLEQGITGYAMATKPLSIIHITPAGVEKDAEPAGTAFSTTPTGPACPHWPIYGCGGNYTMEWADHAFALTYLGRDLVQVSPEEFGQVGAHDNLIVAMSPDRVPAFVDVRIRSVVDAASSYQVAEVDVGSYGNIRHRFTPGFAETMVSLPVELGPWPLEIHVKTVVFVDNTRQLAQTAMVDLGVQVTVRLPSASYTVEGAVTCVGSNGVSFLSPSGSSLPVLGSDFSVTAMNLPLSPIAPAFGLIGTRRFLPFDLQMIGMPNCFLHISSPLAIPLVKCCGTAEWVLPIPMNVDLLGAEFYQQVFAIDESWVNPLGCVITNVGHGTIGVPPSVL